MSENNHGMFQRLSSFFQGVKKTPAQQTVAPNPTSAPTPDDTTTDITALKSRIAGLKMDVGDRDREIARLKREFEHTRKDAQAEAGSAGEAELLKLAKKAAPLLSQLVTLKDMNEKGKDIRPADILKLFSKIEKLFYDIGLQRVGEVGETAEFDPAVHQRMSGAGLQNGDPVKVRFVGYRFNRVVVTKAMVSAGEVSHDDRI
jgi:molecular chaperone GrpE (heat shock protein)